MARTPTAAWRWILQEISMARRPKAARIIGAHSGRLRRRRLALFGNFRSQAAGQRVKLSGVLITRLLAIRHRRRRGKLLKRKRADAHPGIQGDSHAAEIAQFESRLTGPARIE